jgi:hypothetical protein
VHIIPIQFSLILSRIYGSMTNNNGFWIWWLYLLTPSCTISLNHNPLQQPIINSCLDSLHSRSSFFWTELPALEIDSLIATLHVPHGKHSLYCWQSLFTAPLPSNISIVPRVCFCGNVFSDPLPSNGHGADHIENTTCNTFSTVACAYFGRCLEMGPHVTILCYKSARICWGTE